MDLALSEEQQALVDVFTAFFAREVPIGRVRAAEPLGFDERLWGQAVAIGVPGMAVDGAELIDLALVCEQAGARLAPLPLVEAFVAVRALAPYAGLRDEVAGGRLATVALQPAVDRQLRLVPAGAVAEVVVALDQGRLVAEVGSSPGRGPGNLGSAPLADRPIGPGATVLAIGADAAARHHRAVNEWKVLTAAALAGLGAAALSLGVEYAKARHQFGVAIGSFQAVQHTLADAATAVDGARLVAYRAAWAVGRGEVDAAERAATALLFAGQAAQHATSASLHFHGGYGFMLEYDIQLYFRRAKAWLLTAGDPRHQLREIADLRYGPAEALA
jgi:hypothetical protein